MTLLSLRKLAEAIAVAKNQFFEDHKANSDRLTGGFLMASYILQAMGLKTPTESIQQAMERLQQAPARFDLLNEVDRQTLGHILKDMYGQLGVQRIFLIGITGEGKTFINYLSENPEPVPNLREMLRAIADDDDFEEISL